MSEHARRHWPYPGSRWWKFDFHTHTPASLDTHSWQKAIGTDEEVSPEKWLLKYMAAEIDCVAVTDHNSGAWIDELKTTYQEMKEHAEPSDKFRELALFPGVEISVHGGFHLLALFGPEAGTGDIERLLGRVEYSGTRGDGDGVTSKGGTEVVRAVIDAGGIPVPAHADRQGSHGKGLLAVQGDSRACALDAGTVRQVMDVEGLLAVEWEDRNHQPPTCVERQVRRLARVLGSDCHSFRGNQAPGSRYTWIKMARPTLEGLRLALLDGNDVSVRRSDEGPFEPFRRPAHFVAGLEIDSARFMGNNNPERLFFSPYCNALIGGRGTGKSTIVHALRLAYRRDEELQRLGEGAGPCREFERFRAPVKGRDGAGALRENTEIRVWLVRDDVMHCVQWSSRGGPAVVEEQDGDGKWRRSPSQAVSAERFPIRLFSQGQIAAMAGEGRQALLDVIDEAAQISSLDGRFKEARDILLTLRARRRELEGKLQSRPELERRLADLQRKINALAESHHSEVLRAYQQAMWQRREVDATRQQLKETPSRIVDLARDLLLDDWPDGAFDASQDSDAFAWRGEAEQALSEAREELERAADKLAARATALDADRRLVAWKRRAKKAQGDYRDLQASLEEQGVSDPQAFGRWTQERQQLESQLQELDRLRAEYERLCEQYETQWQHFHAARQAITQKRAEFVKDALRGNEFVRMEVVGLGYDEHRIERGLRELLEVQDERFSADLLERSDGKDAKKGLAFDLAATGDRAAALNDIKRRLYTCDENFDGHFRNYLERKLKRPEFADRILCWFPEDDLRIEYRRGGGKGDWSDITQGSQGERSAALLAFLLAFGDEPLVLDQPEDDLDNHLIYELIVSQIRKNKRRRQLIIVTHNPNVVVNGDAEMVHAFAFVRGQCRVSQSGALQEKPVRDEVCEVMEGGEEALSRRWARLKPEQER